MNRVMNACLSAANFGACVVHRGRGVTSRMCMDGGGGGFGLPPTYTAGSRHVLYASVELNCYCY